MIGRHASRGRGVAGAVAYTMHDRGTSANPHPKTSERVAWSATVGSSTDDIDLTVRIMQGIVADAPVIKMRTGGGSAGRKLKNPYDHFVLSWKPGDNPTKAAALEAVDEALQALGYTDHLAIAVMHNDTDADHVHVVACRVSPRTGIAVPAARSGLKLSRWAEGYERARGEIQVPTRVQRREEREQFAAAVNEELKDFLPTGRTVRERSKAKRKARTAAKKRVRGTGNYPLTPLRPARSPQRPLARMARARHQMSIESFPPLPVLAVATPAPLQRPAPAAEQRPLQVGGHQDAAIRAIRPKVTTTRKGEDARRFGR